MRIVSPFPAESLTELHRWLNEPREPNFEADQASDVATVATMVAAKEAAGFTFACTLDGMPIGFLAFTPLTPTSGQFAGMVMAPGFRGKGFGTRFLKWVAEELRGRGYERMSAIVRRENRAVRSAFEKAGAVEDGRVLTFKG